MTGEWYNNSNLCFPKFYSTAISFNLFRRYCVIEFSQYSYHVRWYAKCYYYTTQHPIIKQVFIVYTLDEKGNIIVVHVACCRLRVKYSKNVMSGKLAKKSFLVSLCTNLKHDMFLREPFVLSFTSTLLFLFKFKSIEYNLLTYTISQCSCVTRIRYLVYDWSFHWNYWIMQFAL